LKIWKKMARETTSEYRMPTMTMVGRTRPAAGLP